MKTKSKDIVINGETSGKWAKMQPVEQKKAMPMQFSWQHMADH